jgi:hypothetical protein
MREALLQTQNEVPFNNFTGFLSGDGVDFPKELGGDCLVQAKHLAEGLKEKGVGVKYLVANENNHVAVLASDGEGLFYLDPCIYQDAPSSLAEAFKKATTSVVSARPIVGGLPSRVSVFGTSPSVFCASAASEMKREDGGSLYCSFWQNSFDLSASVEEPPAPYVFAPTKSPSTFLLRVLDGKGSVLELRRDAFSKEVFSVGSMEAFDHIETTADALCGEAEARVLEIAKLVNLEAMVLLETMAAASRLAMKRKGMGVEGVR